MRHTTSGVTLALSVLGLAACATEPGFEPITQPLKLAGGKEVPVATLEQGRIAYTLYCRTCHGELGDGRGPSGIGLTPPPRNFQQPAFKFGGVESGSLPPDSELKRIVKSGLHGTAMLPWQIPDHQLDATLQWIKTFAKDEEGANVWMSEEPAAPTEITDDPWKDKKDDGVKRGMVVYHGLAQCLKCHPAYGTKQQIWDATKEITGEGSTSAFRDDMYNPDAKYSDQYKVKLLPPDFIRHNVKSGSLDANGQQQVTARDVFRTIASGIGGTAMPAWKGSIDDSDIWALSHYVRSLMDLRGKPEAIALRKSLLEQPEFVPPTPEGQPAEGATEGTPAEGAAQPETK